jgi:hypothetical protein
MTENLWFRRIYGVCENMGLKDRRNGLRRGILVAEEASCRIIAIFQCTVALRAERRRRERGVVV